MRDGAFRPQMVEVRVRVRNKGFVGEEIHCFEVGHEMLLNRNIGAKWNPAHGDGTCGSNSTGTEVGDRNTWP